MDQAESDKVDTKINGIKAARDLVDAMSEECWFGINLVLVLADATPEERDSIRVLMDRAKAARTPSVNGR